MSDTVMTGGIESRLLFLNYRLAFTYASGLP
jgi:hypothetical protein